MSESRTEAPGHLQPMPSLAEQRATVALDIIGLGQTRPAAAMAFWQYRTCWQSGHTWNQREPMPPRNNRVTLQSSPGSFGANCGAERRRAADDDRNVGPFLVKTVLANENCELRLPEGLRTHPVLHTALLKRCYSRPDTPARSLVDKHADGVAAMLNCKLFGNTQARFPRLGKRSMKRQGTAF